MPSWVSTGSADLDALIEELRPGDNVVFHTADAHAYRPFVTTLARHVGETGQRILYVRSEGQFDDVFGALGAPAGAGVMDLGRLLHGAGDPLETLRAALAEFGRDAFYVFEPLTTLRPWFPHEGALGALFLSVCPFLYQMDTIAYWGIVSGGLPSATIAAIKDCTQIFFQVERDDKDLLITAAKVWGRFSPQMFRTHRARGDGSHLTLELASVQHVNPGEYAAAVSDKNRELAEIRDALDRSNAALQQRNRELEELNARLAEQGRLYASLRTNLDDLLRLVQAGQSIGSTLVVDQVQHSLLIAAMRLFDAPACRLTLRLSESAPPLVISSGIDDAWEPVFARADVAALESSACGALAPAGIPLDGGAPAPRGSLAVAPIVLRGMCLGSLVLAAPHGRLATDEARTLLTYLSSQASLALDNALLYQEVEVQGEHLRSYVETVITAEEQESRRLALDLHDGLVQMIVASYQHLQTAEAWRGRDPASEEREVQQGTQLVRRAIQEARRLIAQLRPAGLDDFGLVHALRLYVAQVATDADRQIALDVAANWKPLPAPLEAALFRIIQEAITNAIKYSQAPRIEVRLWQDALDLHVAISDNGVGFDPAILAASPKQGTHVGLVGIRERARPFGGRCTITSRPGGGTRIEVSIPLARVPGAAGVTHD